jgi:single-strand DNA-binding protein
MAGEITTTVIGNLAADPELRFIPSGAAVANFTVAQTPRTFDRTTNEWKDGETFWMRCNVWRDTAENVAASLHKGDRVVVTGKLKQRQYDKDGQTHTVVEMEVDEIGAALRYAEVAVRKAQRQQVQPGGQQYDPWATPQQGQQAPQQAPQQPQGQPQQGGWGAPPPQPQQGGWGAPPQYDQPPF